MNLICEVIHSIQVGFRHEGVVYKEILSESQSFAELEDYFGSFEYSS